MSRVCPLDKIRQASTRCGNLGDKYDVTSGLTYMRARYYESETGRFISEDPACASPNWFTYCENEPSQGTDPSGRYHVTNESLWNYGQLAGYCYAMLALIAASSISDLAKKLAFASSLLAMSAASFAVALGAGTDSYSEDTRMFSTVLTAVGPGTLRAFSSWATATLVGNEALKNGIMYAAFAATVVHTLILWGALFNLEVD